MEVICYEKGLGKVPEALAHGSLVDGDVDSDVERRQRLWTFQTFPPSQWAGFQSSYHERRGLGGVGGCMGVARTRLGRVER